MERVELEKIADRLANIQALGAPLFRENGERIYLLNFTEAERAAIAGCVRFALNPTQ